MAGAAGTRERKGRSGAGVYITLNRFVNVMQSKRYRSLNPCCTVIFNSVAVSYYKLIFSPL